MRNLALLMLCLLLTAPSPAQTGTGTILNELKTQVGVYTVQFDPGSEMQIGDIVTVTRGEQKLGEATLSKVSGDSGEISLKGAYAAKSGDVIAFARRPQGVSAGWGTKETTSSTGSSGSSSSSGSGTSHAGAVWDSKREFSLVPARGWSVMKGAPKKAEMGSLTLASQEGSIAVFMSMAMALPPAMWESDEARKAFSEGYVKGAKQQGMETSIDSWEKITIGGQRAIRFHHTTSGTPGVGFVVPRFPRVLLALSFTAAQADEAGIASMLETVAFKK